jgi:hypothetical protein
MKLYDEFNWVKKVINSCTKQEQISACKKLIRIFYNKNYPELELGSPNSDYVLMRTLDVMWNELHNEVKKII